MTNKSLFDTFPNLDDARDLINILEEEEIEFSLIDNAFDVDITFTGNRTSSIQLFLFPSDFDRVHKLIEDKAEKLVDLSDKTHYLHKFSTDELYEILAKKNEWNSYDYAFAKRLLKERGKDVSESHLKAIQQERNEKLDRPEKSSTIQIVIGYICAMLGGVLGILIGWYLWKAKRTTSNGNKIFSYSESDRIHGKYIFILGILIVLGFAAFRITMFINKIG